MENFRHNRYGGQANAEYPSAEVANAEQSNAEATNALYSIVG